MDGHYYIHGINMHGQVQRAVEKSFTSEALLALRDAHLQIYSQTLPQPYQLQGQTSLGPPPKSPLGAKVLRLVGRLVVN